MKKGDVCAVRVTLSGAWPGWYLAHIIECDMWADSISVVRVIGETFGRDSFEEINTILDANNQASAKRLALKSPFVPVRYERRCDLTEAILSA